MYKVVEVKNQVEGFAIKAKNGTFDGGFVNRDGTSSAYVEIFYKRTWRVGEKELGSSHRQQFTACLD